MKTKIVFLTLFAALMCIVNRTTAQVDLLPGLNYSYTPPGANGIIAIGEIDILNNGSGTAGSFDVALYIYNSGANKAYIIWDSTLAGENGNSLIPLTNFSVNINKTPNIPAGTYKLGVWVNYQHMVTETDTTNNAGLLSGSWSYTPDAINELASKNAEVRVYPNPSSGNFVISLSHSELVSESHPTLEVFNILGENVRVGTLKQVQGDNNLDLSSEPNGVYIYRILSADGTLIATGKLIKQ